MAASSSHSGDWLHAPPIASIGLRLSDEAVWLAVAQRLVPDTYAESHIGDTATEAGAAANQAAANKIAKYDERRDFDRSRFGLVRFGSEP